MIISPHSMRTRATLTVGDSGTFSKTITEQDVFEFAAASGDYNPVHVDEAYAKHTVFGRRVAHGVLTAGLVSTVLASEIPGVGTIFVELHIRFMKPVFLGDTVTANATCFEIINPKRVRMMVACVNQNHEDVALGNALIIPPTQTKLLDYLGHDA